jgi:hypothetical protein
VPSDHEPGSELKQKSLFERIAHAVLVGIEAGLLLRLLRGHQSRGKQCEDKKEGSGTSDGSHMRRSASDPSRIVYAPRGVSIISSRLARLNSQNPHYQRRDCEHTAEWLRN